MAANSVYEQLILELINRARLDPAAEAERLGIGLNDGISGGSISTAAKQVLAANPLLVDAARAHSQWMLDVDVFSHSGQGGSSPTQRMQAAGYTLSGSWSTGENIAWAGTTGSLNIASYTQYLHDNLFKSAGHRLNILNSGFREIGIGELTGNFSGYNAAIVTENFARSGSKYFITGVAITDADGDEFYDIGEARSGISVSVSGQGSDVTETAGGYKVAVNAGTHTVTFSGGGLSSPVAVTVAAGLANAKVDLVGANKVLSSADATLGAGARDLSLLGVAALDGTGNGQSNVLRGNKGANSLNGMGGNDIIYGLAGNDIIEGGTGSDTVAFAGRRTDFTITQNADGSYTVTDTNGADGLNEGRDTIRGAEFLRFDGSGETITLSGTPEPDPPEEPTDPPPAEDPPDPPSNPPAGSEPTLGDDDVAGTDNADTIDLLAGNDRGSGGAGDDNMYGGLGDDVLYGDDGIDWLFGGEGADQLFGGNQGDYLYGEGGDDHGYGGKGSDWLYGGSGRDILFGEDHNDFANGQDGNDTLRGGNGADRLFGGNDLDLIFGDDGNDSLYGGNDNDRLFGGNHNDFVTGQNGNDTLRGGNGADRLFGGNDLDVIFGENGNDYLNGGNGNDRLFGGNQNDQIIGGRGNDRIDGDGGRDTAIYAGGSGRYDVHVFQNGNVRVTDLHGGDGVDLLVDIEVLQFSDGTFLI